MTEDAGYLLANAQAEAGVRFSALASLFDPPTFRHLRGLGLGAGWRCWEVGAGGRSVPRWLAYQVGPAGRVLATDVDVSWMTADDQPDDTVDETADDAAGYEVARHDVGAEPPPAEIFDLVHARLVLVHVPNRDAALRAMVSVVRPGGWLLLEDADPALQPLSCPDEYGPEQRLANHLRRGFRSLLAQRGADLAYGRTLPRLLRAAGLVDVRADAFFPIASPACVQLERATVAQIRARLVANGLATEEDIKQHLANLDDGRLDPTPAPMISAWGRKP